MSTSTLIISHMCDNNIYHFLIYEVYAIVRSICDLTGIDVDNDDLSRLDLSVYTIVLHAFQHNPVHSWRYALLNTMFPNRVYVYEMPTSSLSAAVGVTLNILQDVAGSATLVDPWHFDMACKPSKFWCEFITSHVYRFYNITHLSCGTRVVYIERRHNRILYDYKTNELLSDVLRRELSACGIDFDVVSFEDSSCTLETQVRCMHNARVLVSVHGAANTNLCFLPPGAHVFEVNFRKHWHCDPVCFRHRSNEISYREDCGAGLKHYPQFHKADYHNLARFFDKQYHEFEVIDAHHFIDANPINLRHLFVDGDHMTNCIKNVYNV